MAQNHLIIGLGGTGGKVIRALRKTIFQEFKDARPEGACLEYLYVDSSNEFMKPDDPTWRVLGKSVQLEPKHQLLITGANLVSVLDNIDNYPGIQGWIGNRGTWQDILKSIVGDTLGGQKRRLGRFLLACKANELRGKLESLTRDLIEASGNSEITFHVCCGLAGGTGSGTVVDVVSQIRDMFPEPRRYRVLVYALLPEAHPPKNWNTGNYHANGYAALQELNALSVGKLSPYDITGRKGRLELSDPFNGAYLFTTENENGLALDTEKDIPEILADFLYHKVVAAQAMSWPVLAKMENAENGDGTPECAPYTKDPERSKRFLAFGIKRLAIPVDEIREFVAYHFAKAALLRFLFNNWTDGAGFLDHTRAFDASTYALDKANLEQWSLTDEHFTLSTGLLDSELKWKPHRVDWQEFGDKAKRTIQNDFKEKSKWLPELARLFKTRFDEQYRGLGVQPFFASKLKARREHARAIRTRIETHLFGEWLGGRLGLGDVLAVLNAVLGTLSDRMSRLDDKLSKTRDAAKAELEKVQMNNATYAKAGPVSLSMMGVADKLLAAQTVALTGMYACLTDTEALHFGRQLLDVLVSEEVQSLRADVAAMQSHLSGTLQQVQENISSRCADVGKSATLRPLVRYYNPQEVQELSSILFRDQDNQNGQVANFQKLLEGLLSGKREFAPLAEKLSGRRLLDLLEEHAAEAAQVAQEELHNRRAGTRRLLDDDIIGRLQDDFGGSEEALKGYLAQLVEKAGCFLAQDTGEVTKQGPGVPEGAATGIADFSVLLPSSQNVGFLNTVFESIKATYRGVGNVTRVPSDGRRRNEIVFISLRNLFPLRFANQVGILRDRYQERLQRADSGRAALEVHTEGDGSGWASIYLPTKADLLGRFLPYLFIAKASGAVRPKSDTAGGLVLARFDADGFEESAVELGANFFDAVDRMSARLWQDVTAAAQERLGAVSTLDRSGWQDLVRLELESVKALAGGNTQDDRYRLFLSAAKKSMELLRSTP